MNKLSLPLLLGLALTLAACATTVTGSAVDSAGNVAGPVPPTIPAGLDVGKFPTTLRAVPTPSTDTAWVIEGNRMGDALISVNEVDPRLTIGGIALRSYPVLRGTQLSERVPDATVDAFYDAKMRVGMTTTRGDRLAGPTVALRVGLYRFDSPDDAAKALAAIRTKTPRQRPVTITGTDGVLASEFKPGTVDSYRTEGPFVINVSGTAPTTAEATAFVTRAYALQVPRVEQFSPTPSGSIQSLPGDKDGIMARTIYDNSSQYSAPLNNSYFDFAGLKLRLENIDDAEKYREAGVDLVGQGVAFVYRARDTAAAKKLHKDTRRALPEGARSIDGPAGISTIRCTQYGGTDPYVGCRGQVGRFIFSLSGDTAEKARQAAAAQWAVLARNP